MLRRCCSYLRGIFKLKFVTFLFVSFFKGLFSLRGCVATGIMWVKLKLNLKLGIYIFFFVIKNKKEVKKAK